MSAPRLGYTLVEEHLQLHNPEKKQGCCALVPNLVPKSTQMIGFVATLATWNERSPKSPAADCHRGERRRRPPANSSLRARGACQCAAGQELRSRGLRGLSLNAEVAARLEFCVDLASSVSHLLQHAEPSKQPVLWRQTGPGKLATHVATSTRLGEDGKHFMER